MGRQAVIVLYVLALVAVVVGVDVLFFRNRFWERRNSPGVRSVLSEVPEALMSVARPLTGGNVRFWPKADMG